jgi:TRAP-type C4-dicarboxylate transport system permease large subunit
MDDLAFMVLATPIFFPTAVALGYDPIWFGVIIVIMMEQGLITPPVVSMSM